jgi:hypothetical protein
MLKALSQFDANLEEIRGMLVNIAVALDRIPSESDAKTLNEGIEKAFFDISNVCELLDARRIIFSHELNNS